MSNPESVHPWPGVPSTHPMFRGHFPGNPVVPGSVIVAEVLQCLSRHHAGSPVAYELMTVKFATPLRPDTAVLVRFRHEREGHVSFTAESHDTTIAAGRVRADFPDSTVTIP